MSKTLSKKKIRSRTASLVLDTSRYGAAAVLLGALTAAFWFAQRALGIAMLSVACVFAAVTLAYFLIGFFFCRSFFKLSKDGAAPYALINEYGHLELCGGERETVRRYAEFSVQAYGKMYRPVGDKPDKDEILAAKAEQKRILAEEKALTAQLTPYRQFDNFTPADLSELTNKTIFLSERMFRIAAEAADWQKAKDTNEIVIIRGPVLGQKTER